MSLGNELCTPFSTLVSSLSVNTLNLPFFVTDKDLFSLSSVYKERLWRPKVMLVGFDLHDASSQFLFQLLLGPQAKPHPQFPPMHNKERSSLIYDGLCYLNERCSNVSVITRSNLLPRKKQS